MTPADTNEFELPPEPKPMNEFSRLVGVFVSPGRAFADIALRPRWWVPVLLAMVLMTGYFYLYSEKIGWDTYIRDQFDRSGATVSPEQRAQALAVYRRFGPIISVFAGLINPILVALVIATVLKILADVVMGAAVGFKRTLAAVTYGMMPVTVLGVILAAIVMQFQPPEDFQLENPLMFNASAFVAQDAPRWIATLAGSLDLFSFWSMFLIAVGMGAASRKLSTGKAFGMILFPWALYVILRVGAAAAFG